MNKENLLNRTKFRDFLRKVSVTLSSIWRYKNKNKVKKSNNKLAKNIVNTRDKGIISQNVQRELHDQQEKDELSIQKIDK